VKEGDTVTEGDNMVEMSTAKAVVELPAPFSGKIIKFHGGPGDVIDTGAVLVSFQLEGEDAPVSEPEKAPEPKEVAAEPAPEPEVTSGQGEIFKLPDLGEGLPDAEIVSWVVKEGDQVTEGDNMVEMSTAKAVVEVPSPFTGTVVKLYGGPGDVILTGAPLIEINTGSKPSAKKPEPEMKPVKEAKGDSGTVVGAVVVGDEIKSETKTDASGIKASAAVRAQARKLKINLASIKGTGPDGAISLGDVKRAAEGGAPEVTAKPIVSGDVSISPAAKTTAMALGIDIGAVQPEAGAKMVTKGDVLRAAKDNLGGAAAPSAPIATSKEVQAAPKVRAYAASRGIDLATIKPTGHVGNITMADVEGAKAGVVQAEIPQGTYARPERAFEVTGEPQKLVGPRRVMAQAMAKANAEVCNTSIFDQVSLNRWAGKQDITVRIMRSIIAASFAEPALNALFDGEGMEKTTSKSVHLGVAVDSPKGLFVPVIKGADKLDGAGLRAELNRLRKAIDEGTIKTTEMMGATITMTNFGMIAGRFATPIVLPPQVAIVGIGGLFEQLVLNEKGIENQRFMPISLTFDHRASTGGEAARFLAGVLNDLALAF
ncbi:MAG: 2-oxo acid dehydrogenase subunit E2, partial [Sphingomonadales bacterium]